MSLLHCLNQLSLLISQALSNIHDQAQLWVRLFVSAQACLLLCREPKPISSFVWPMPGWHHQDNSLIFVTGKQVGFQMKVLWTCYFLQGALQPDTSSRSVSVLNQAPGPCTHPAKGKRMGMAVEWSGKERLQFVCFLWLVPGGLEKAKCYTCGQLDGRHTHTHLLLVLGPP